MFDSAMFDSAMFDSASYPEVSQSNLGDAKASRLSFLGEGPVQWFAFIGAILLMLFLWGRIIKFLSEHD